MAKKSSTPFFIKYKNLTLIAVGILFAIALETLPFFQPYIILFSSLGFVGGIIAGMLFVSTFTVATGAVLLSFLLPQLGIWQLALIAGIGALLGDLIIFKFVRGGLVGEVLPIYKKLGGSHLNKLLHTKLFSWTLPILGAFIMMSPLPDELGVSLLGISKISTAKFMVLSFTLNFIGLFLFISLVLLARSVM